MPSILKGLLALIVSLASLSGCRSKIPEPKQGAPAPRLEDSVVIRGVVAPDGEINGGSNASGSPGLGASDSDSWVTSLELLAWRTPDGKLEKSRLRLWSFCASSSELEQKMEGSPKAGSCVEVRVGKAKRMRGLGRDFADDERELIEIKGDVDDPELIGLARQLSPPESFPSELFGTLELVPRFADLYEGKRKLPGGGSYRILVRVSEPAKAASVIADAEQLALRLEKHLDAVRLGAARKLVDTYNGSWREGPPLTAQQMAAKLELETFSYEDPDARHANVSFDDGGLFLGHSIEVQLEADGTVSDAELAG